MTSPRGPLSVAERAREAEEAKSKLLNTILETDEKMRIYHHNKLEKSSRVFANTKVTSCSSVLMSNGMTVAIPFRSQSTLKGANGHHAPVNMVSVTQ